MQLTILWIENEIVNCQLKDGSVINIAQKWFMDGSQEGDIIERTKPPAMLGRIV